MRYSTCLAGGTPKDKEGTGETPVPAGYTRRVILGGLYSPAGCRSQMHRYN
ncbi:MAG: hypothetical protein WD491_09275 [Balneolales bacterium]